MREEGVLDEVLEYGFDVDLSPGISQPLVSVDAYFRRLSIKVQGGILYLEGSLPFDSGPGVVLDLEAYSHGPVDQTEWKIGQKFKSAVWVWADATLKTPLKALTRETLIGLLEYLK